MDKFSMDIRDALKQLPEVLHDFKYDGTGIIGLKNLGNTCYLNSTIQCLSNTLPLTEYILKGKYIKYLSGHTNEKNELPNEIALIINYHNLLESIWEDEGEANGTYVISPKYFYEAFSHFFPEGGIFRQNDSQESLVFFLDTLHELICRPVKYQTLGTPKNDLDNLTIKSINDWSQHFKNQHSYILDLFYGQEHLRLKCLNCKEITHNFPPFMYTCLPIKNPMKTIYDCFEDHCSVEQLDQENSWECDKCKTKSRAYKKTAYWKLPQILIITLNRFQVHSAKNNFHYHVKNEEYIDYPITNLDLSDYVTCPIEKQKAHYNLYAICCHVGSTNYGHYYSFTQNGNGRWYRINDDSMNVVKDLRELITEDAYILFYQKA